MEVFDNWRHIWFDAMVVEGDLAWVFLNNYNALYEIDLKSDRLTWLASIPTEGLLEIGLYFSMKKYNDELILIPAAATSIAIYNLATHDLETIPLDFEVVKCFSAEVYDGNLYMIGYDSARIAVLDLNRRTVRVLLNFENMFNKLNIDKMRMHFRKSSCIVENHLFLANCNSDVVLDVDLHDEQVELFRIGRGVEGLSTIVSIKDDFLIWEWGRKRVFVWNKSEGVKKEILFGDLEEEYIVSDIVMKEDFLWMFPLHGDGVYIMDIRGEEIKKLNEFDVFMTPPFIYPWGGQMFTVCLEEREKIFVFVGNKFTLVEYNLNTHMMYEHKLLLDGIKRLQEYMNREKKMFESKMLKIENFLELVTM